MQEHKKTWRWRKSSVFILLWCWTKVGENHKQQYWNSQDTQPIRAVLKSSISWPWMMVQTRMSQRSHYCPSMERDICWLLMSELTDSAEKHRHCRSFNISLSDWAQGHLTSFVQRNQGGVDLSSTVYRVIETAERQTSSLDLCQHDWRLPPLCPTGWELQDNIWRQETQRWWN